VAAYRSFGIKFISSDNLRFLLESYLLNHFFRDAISKKEVFKFLNQFKILTYSTTHATVLWIFFPNLGIWIQGSGAMEHISSTTYFLNFWKIRI
jgi:hypothetical protein